MPSASAASGRLDDMIGSRSFMQQQRQPGQQSIMRRSQLAQRHSSDIDQILGVNTSSSRNHSKVISNALDALKSYNDRALLTAMMTKEHNRKASSSSPANVEGGGGGDISTHQVQSRVHAAMQAQLRQLEEYSAEQYERTSPSEGGGRGAHDMVGGIITLPLLVLTFRIPSTLPC